MLLMQNHKTEIKSFVLPTPILHASFEYLNEILSQILHLFDYINMIQHCIIITEVACVTQTF